MRPSVIGEAAEVLFRLGTYQRAVCEESPCDSMIYDAPFGAAVMRHTMLSRENSAKVEAIVADEHGEIMPTTAFESEISISSELVSETR